MTEIVLHDIEPRLVERIRLVADTHGWALDHALSELLQRGLDAFEEGLAAQLADHESNILRAAIAAMEHVPDDPGFAHIGRAGPGQPVAWQPDQSITPDLQR